MRLAVALLLTGCVHADLQRNASGLADVRTPPADPGRQGLETPADPGERMVVLSSGVLLAPAKGAGLEVSLQYGSSDVRHEHGAGQFGLLLPDRALALNLGAELWRSGDHPKAAYLEVQYGLPVIGLSAGPVFIDGGPRAQATGFIGPLYLRTRGWPGEAASFEIGFFFKAPLTLVWSR